MKIQAKVDIFPLKNTFTISRGSRNQAEVLTVSINENGVTGYGECVPYLRYDETIESVLNQINNVQFLNRLDLQTVLPPGAARNALDCALWDLEAKKNKTSVYKLAQLNKPKPVLTAYTLSLDDPIKMGEQAKMNSFRHTLKIKLGSGDLDFERIKEVKKNAPNSNIIVDANEGWSIKEYQFMAPKLLDLGVKMVEQPLPSENDDELLGIKRSLPVCADESCHDRTSLEKCLGKYDLINIKLDKTGGLTEALLLKEKALSMDFEVMVGCMIGSSLAMAPAVLIAQDVKWVDLDGPLLLAQDRKNSLDFSQEGIHPPSKKLWG
tara:strand:+ start:321 stop:1286 length:966 start_codon:yes stop_codon:yes gene_type:complete